MNTNLTKEVEVIGSINFEGNVIPMEWYNHIRCESGKPDAISIMILSDIIYWYRPTVIRNELTGKVIGYRKKFKADLLQRSYTDIENQFGFSRSQIKDSLKRLEKKGLIIRVFRNISNQGSTIANVMFLKPFPDKIKKITTPETGMKKFPHTYEEISLDVCGNLSPHLDKILHTYTETTTKITTNNSLSLNLKEKLKNSSSKKEEKRESEMIKIWNNLIEKKLGREVKLTSKRESLLKNSLIEFFDNNISLWEFFCNQVAKSKFLMGEVTDFRVQLDWVLKSDNMIKVIEGNYNREEEKKESDENTVTQIQKLTKEIQKSATPDFWQQMMKTLLEEKGIATFKSWFKNNNYLKFEDGIIKIKAPSKFSAQWQIDNFWDDIVGACKKNIPNFKQLEITY